jgi:DNA-directed RNA polymerase subunit L
MKFNIIKMAKNEVEVELDEKDPTLTELIASKLNNYDNVDFAASKWEHPLVDKPKIYLRVKSGDALKTLKKAIEDLKKELKEIKNAL